MLVICRVVVMTMHRPEKVFLETVGMAMFGNHLDMVVDRLQDPWRVVGTWRNSPGEERKTQDKSQDWPQTCRGFSDPHHLFRSCDKVQINMHQAT